MGGTRAREEVHGRSLLMVLELSVRRESQAMEEEGSASGSVCFKMHTNSGLSSILDPIELRFLIRLYRWNPEIMPFELIIAISTKYTIKVSIFNK